MAQLHATVDEIQLTKNMIIADPDTTLATALEDWTDEEYPSALAVAELISKTVPDKVEHPVGSVVITSTNENPGASLGGTWTLVDKGFKNASANISPLWTNSRADAAGYIYWADHSICLKMWLTTDNNPLSAGNNIGNIDRAKAGVTEFSISDEGGIALAVSGMTNTTSYVIKYRLDGGGYLGLDKIYDETVAAIANATIHIHTIIPINYDDMIDSFCDKFYWKRTA